MEKIDLKYQLSDYENHLIEVYNKNCDIYNSQNTLSESAKTAYTENKSIYNELTLLDTFNEDIMFEMSTFKKEKSGLPFNIWLDDAGIYRTNKHSQPRLKVQDPDDLNSFISVLIDKDEPKILAGKFKRKQNLKSVFEYIKTNYEELIKVWNQEIDASDFITAHNIKNNG